MEDAVRRLALDVALAIELLVVITIVVGAIETLVCTVRYLLRPPAAAGARRQVWLGFARWLLLALEFALAADIVRTVIAPTWNDIGQLAAIAAIRTALGFFLERDIDSVIPPPQPG